MMMTTTMTMTMIAVHGGICSMICFLIEKNGNALWSQGLPLQRIKYYKTVLTGETRYRFASFNLALFTSYGYVYEEAISDISVISQCLYGTQH